MFKRTLLLMMALISVPVVNANETNPHMQAITQQLKHLIDQADSTGFKDAFDENITKQTQQWLITQENAADCTNTLLSYAQAKRDALQQQYGLLPAHAKNYKALAKGAGQSYLGVCCGLGAITASYIYADTIIRDKFPNNYPSFHKSLAYRCLTLFVTEIGCFYCALPSAYIAAPVAFHARKDVTGHELTVTAAWLIPTLIACLGTKYLTRYGAKNLKQGWNYKTHLETQIKNLDGIIAYIENPIGTAVTEELA